MLKAVTIIYDGECPFCSNYVRFLNLKRSVETVTLIDARQGGDIVRGIQAKGYDLDEGMVLLAQNEIFYGADCINRLALMSTSSGIFNRLNVWIFSHPKLAKFLYPFMKFGRAVTLKLMGRRKINAVDAG